MFVFRQKLLL
uniref:Uncharacterized protein n=1 Tax=Rhizophora mucronata TaxID=61149 RepID=A0A2P2N5A5_RHIMU